MFNEMILHMANDKTMILVWLHDEEYIIGHSDCQIQFIEYI